MSCNITDILLCYKGGATVGACDDFEMMEEDPLKTPDDIIEAVEDSKTSGDHSDIHKILNDRKINLRSRIVENGRCRMIVRKLLEDSVNGDKIVEKELDKSIKQIGKNENTIDYGFEVDFEGIFKDGSSRQTRVVKELLDMRAVSREGEERDAYNRLITHPVIAIFIYSKWKNSRWYFYLNSAIFTSFLGFYSAFIWKLFSRPEEYCRNPQRIVFPDQEDQDQLGDCILKLSIKDDYYNKMSTSPHFGFLTDFEDGFMIVELFFLILLILLILAEIYQVMVLKLQYLKELENYIEWIVIISAIVTIAMKKHMVDAKDPNAAIVRGIAALGICAAWLELIFIIGRYPFRGGDFSIMFYNIIKKTFRYVIALAMMIFGFAFAFMVINFGVEREPFENPLKSSMMTLTMILGEFNFGDMYDSFKNDSVSRGFAMGILLLLIILGTITMVNLFVVVIISDLKKLREDVFTQSLVNMATYSFLVEALLPETILKKNRVDETILVCGHSLCCSPCTGVKFRVPGDVIHIKERIQDILEKRKKCREDTEVRLSSCNLSGSRLLVNTFTTRDVN